MFARVSEFFPMVKTIKGYKKEYLSKDIIAAITVAIISIPQSIAYAIIAGVPPVYGLYTTVVSSIFGAAFGSSKHLVAGPTNAICLLIAGTMSEYMNKPSGLEMLFFLTLLVGIFRLAFAVLKMGKILEFISGAVIVGYTTGAGILIVLGQLKSLLGISVPSSYTTAQSAFYYTVTHLNSTNLFSLAIGLFTILSILGIKKINNKLPNTIIAVVLAAAAVAAFSLVNFGVKLTDIPAGFSGFGALPPFHLPKFNFGYLNSLWSGALAIAIIGLVEATSIAKSTAALSGQKLNINQEIVGQGMSNIAGAFFSSFPSSGSLTRTAINYQSGGMTKLAAVFSGFIVAIVLVFLGFLIKYIPSAALAGVIMVIAYGMVNKKTIVSIITSESHDKITLLITFLATIILPSLDWAVYIGVITSIVLYLNTTNTARVKFLVKKGDSYIQKSISDKSVKDDILTVELAGNLYFGLAQDLEKKLDSIVGKADGFVLRLRNVINIDITALDMLTRFVKKVKSRGGHVIVCGAVKDVYDVIINDAEFCNNILDIYRRSDEYFDSYLEAYDKVQKILKPDKNER